VFVAQPFQLAAYEPMKFAHLNMYTYIIYAGILLSLTLSEQQEQE
jgi:hypothetical protein